MSAVPDGSGCIQDVLALFCTLTGTYYLLLMFLIQSVVSILNTVHRGRAEHVCCVCSISTETLPVDVISSNQDEPSTLQLLKKHLVLEQTIEDYAETIGLLSQQCRQLLEMGHPDWWVYNNRQKETFHHYKIYHRYYICIMMMMDFTTFYTALFKFIFAVYVWACRGQMWGLMHQQINNKSNSLTKKLKTTIPIFKCRDKDFELGFMLFSF